MDSRRRVERVHLTRPLPARVAGQRAFILDASTLGFGIAHQSELSSGDEQLMTFEWDGEQGDAVCRVVRTEVARRTAHRAAVTYNSGFEIVGDAPGALRSLVAWHVTRALDEQKANWKGIPPVAASSVQTASGTAYVRHELIGGLWRQLPTDDPRQPRNGFTVPAEQSAAEIALLRRTFETGDRSARELLQRMAEMSVSNPDGVPARRYTP